MSHGATWKAIRAGLVLHPVRKFRSSSLNNVTPLTLMTFCCVALAYFSIAIYIYVYIYNVSSFF